MARVREEPYVLPRMAIALGTAPWSAAGDIVKAARDSQDPATPTPARARQMLNGILVVQKPLATLAITQRIVPLIHNNFDPLCVSCTLEVRSL